MKLVILSGATASRSEAVAESKDPYPLRGLRGASTKSDDQDTSRHRTRRA